MCDCNVFLCCASSRIVSTDLNGFRENQAVTFGCYTQRCVRDVSDGV